MKKLGDLLSKFWFWVIMAFLFNIFFRASGVIGNNKVHKNNLINIEKHNLINTSYKPNNIACFNNTYKEKLSNGKEILINLKSAIYDDKSLIVSINFPNKNDLKDIFHYINFKVLDKKGREIPLEQIDFISDESSKFILNGRNLDKAYWLVLNPKENNESLTYEIGRGFNLE
ncbi:hypothetical protein [Clostridium massiliamazoniense]|uniref:hypothetical protein n=1 Tax=Clostridium massiliamazoniense TaxID=1347366 RepID=UPI0006D79840|nr:hypothetical protein [Clostridium massiliamazoniense]